MVWLRTWSTLFAHCGARGSTSGALKFPAMAEWNCVVTRIEFGLTKSGRLLDWSVGAKSSGGIFRMLKTELTRTLQVSCLGRTCSLRGSKVFCDPHSLTLCGRVPNSTEQARLSRPCDQLLVMSQRRWNILFLNVGARNTKPFEQIFHHWFS